MTVQYRYQLHRMLVQPSLIEAHNRMVCWIMLNPSTADDEQDDPTIRRVKAFSLSAGFHFLVVVNLFAMRATSPLELTKVPIEVAIGGSNDAATLGAVNDSAAVVAAWGNLPRKRLGERRQEVVERFLKGRPNVWTLGKTKQGEPLHPLYLPKSTTWMVEAFS